MFCPECATELVQGIKYCRTCGTDVRLVPAAMAGDLPTGNLDTSSIVIAISGGLAIGLVYLAWFVVEPPRNAWDLMRLVASLSFLGNAFAYFMFRFAPPTFKPFKQQLGYVGVGMVGLFTAFVMGWLVLADSFPFYALYIAGGLGLLSIGMVATSLYDIAAPRVRSRTDDDEDDEDEEDEEEDEEVVRPTTLELPAPPAAYGAHASADHLEDVVTRRFDDRRSDEG
jgi:hypothetical protein